MKTLALARAADDKISRVHQDEDFIYPTLDMSDEEDYIPHNTKDDETWNPKIKVSHLQPKRDRPTREGTKNIAIEKGLKRAAEKRASFLQLKRSGKIHKKKSLGLSLKSVMKSPIKKDILESKNLSEISKDKNRIRKGGATAKQRLGKILKLK